MYVLDIKKHIVTINLVLNACVIRNVLYYYLFLNFFRVTEETVKVRARSFRDHALDFEPRPRKIKPHNPDQYYYNILRRAHRHGN